MDTKRKIFNLIILDESGSMSSIEKPTIAGFNETVQTIKGQQQHHPEETHYISVVSFNGMGIKTLLWNQPASELYELDGTRYRPDANTPLYDAMGMAFTRLRAQLELLQQYHVLVTVFTDGMENASKEYSGEAIRRMVEELKPQNWTFTYIGANHDVAAAAHRMGITNIMRFMADDAGVAQALKFERSSRSAYYRKLRENKAVQEDFFKGEEE